VHGLDAVVGVEIAQPVQQRPQAAIGQRRIAFLHEVGDDLVTAPTIGVPQPKQQRPERVVG
jgi:hypothetical protein